MKEPTPLSLARLAGAGSAVIGMLVAGLLLGLGAARILRWEWAVPIGILLGFVAGMASLFRTLSEQMK